MTGWTTLPGGLVFAVAGGLAAPLFVACMRPLVGGANALSLFAILISAVYVFGLAARPGPGLGAAVALAVPALVLWLFGAAPMEIAFLCAVLIGVLRSGWLRRDRRPDVGFARAFAIEVVLVGAGLGLGAWTGQGALFPIPMGVWSFFLVQSAYALVGGPAAFEARSAPSPEADAFEAAARRARSLLEKRG